MTKKILPIAGSVFLFLSLVLCVHIYLVTRPKAPDQTTRIMARIDIKEQINQTDAEKITAWLYQQKGIDRVMVNAATDIVVFTYFPIKTDGNKIVKDFQSAFSYKSNRYLPTEAEIESGCPITSNSTGHKIYTYIKHIF